MALTALIHTTEEVVISITNYGRVSRHLGSGFYIRQISKSQVIINVEWLYKSIREQIYS